MKTKKLIAMLLVTSLTIGLMACGSSTSSSETVESETKETEESKDSAEGESAEEYSVEQKNSISVYTASVEEEAIAVFDKFTEETGIEVNYVRLSVGECVTRLETEQENPQVSVYYGGSVDSVITAYDKGLIEPYVASNIDVVDEEYQDPDGIYTPFSIVLTGFASSTEWLEENGLEAPTTWAELVSDTYAENICMAHPATSGAAYIILSILVQMMGEDEAFEYLKELDANIVQYTKAGAAPMRMAGLGETGVAIGHDLDAVTVINEGYDLQLTYPEEGTCCELSCVALVKDGPEDEQEAARTFIDWLLTESAQEQSTNDFYRYPVNKNVEVNSALTPLDEVTFIDYDFVWSGENKTRLVERFENEVHSSADVLE